MADPVDFAVQNAIMPLGQRAVDAQQQGINARNDQVFGQTMQATSLAQRGAQMQQNQSQFDVVQNLRERQQDLNQQMSMAQLSALGTDQQLKQIQLQQVQRQLDVVPLQQQAGVDFQNAVNGTISNATTPQEFDALLNQKLAANPDTIRNFPGGINGLQSATLQAKSAFMGTALQQMQAKQQLADQETVLNAQSLGIDPSNYALASQDGRPAGFDMNNLRAAVTDAQTQKQQAAETFQSNLVGQRQLENIQGRNEGMQAVETQRLQGQSVRIQSNQSKVQYQAAMKARSDAYKAMQTASPGSDAYDAAQEEFNRQGAIADQIYGKDTGQSPQSTSSYLDSLMASAQTPGGFSAVPAGSSPSAPPPSGAQKGTDGNWYVQQNGKWFQWTPPKAP